MTTSMYCVYTAVLSKLTSDYVTSFHFSHTLSVVNPTKATTMPDHSFQSTSAPSKHQCTCTFRAQTEEEDVSIRNLAYECNELNVKVVNASLYKDFDWVKVGNEMWKDKDGELEQLKASILAKRRLLPLCEGCSVSIFIRVQMSDADCLEPDRYCTVIWAATLSQRSAHLAAERLLG
jgi:hypothetical protein